MERGPTQQTENRTLPGAPGPAAHVGLLLSSGPLERLQCCAGFLHGILVSEKLTVIPLSERA